MFDFIGVSRYASKELRKEPIVSTIPFTPKKSDERPDESTLTDRQRKVLDAIKTHLAKQDSLLRSVRLVRPQGLKARHPSNTSFRFLTKKASSA